MFLENSKLIFERSLYFLYSIVLCEKIDVKWLTIRPQGYGRGSEINVTISFFIHKASTEDVFYILTMYVI